MPRLTPQEVRDRVQRLEEVATLPASLGRILMITQKATSTALDLAEEIARDPALTAKLLRTVNSSFYGFNRRIQTVSDAVILLGFTEVERLALMISVVNLFGSGRRRAVALGQLWRHCLVASIAADAIAATYSGGKPESAAGAHVAALLHDIGKAVIWQCFPEFVTDLIRRVATGDCTSAEAEAEVLCGATHGDVGAWVSERWSLPAPIVESIGMHHLPEESTPKHMLLKVTRLANAACYLMDAPAVRPSETVTPTMTVEYYPAMEESLLHVVREHVQRRRDLINIVSESMY